MKKVIGLLVAGALSAATAAVLIISTVNGIPGADKPGMTAGDAVITTMTTPEIEKEDLVRPDEENPDQDNEGEPETTTTTEVAQQPVKVKYDVFYYHSLLPEHGMECNNNGSSATAIVEEINRRKAAGDLDAFLLEDYIGRMDPIKREGSKGGDPILTAQAAVTLEKITHKRYLFFEDLGECDYLAQNQMSNRIKRARWLLLKDMGRWHKIVLDIENYYRNEVDLELKDIRDSKIQFWIEGYGDPDNYESFYREFAGTNNGYFRSVKATPHNPEDDISYLLTECGYQGTDIPGVPPDTPENPPETTPRITTGPPVTTTRVSTTTKTTTTPKRTTSTSKRTTTVTTKVTTSRTTLQTKDPNLGPTTRPGSVDTNVDTSLKTRPPKQTRPTTVATTVKITQKPTVTQPKVTTKPNVSVNPEGTQNKPLQTDTVPKPVDTGPANSYIDPSKGDNKFG